MPRLFSYRVRFDAGSAPNPFWHCCTLVICKPKIRRAAREGDWVVGTGASNTPAGDMSNRVVYAMEVTQKPLMENYEGFARENCPEKVPDWRSPDPRRRQGDAIYDFRSDPPRVRRGAHTEANRAKDLSGRYALVSNRFFYFGARAVKLPKHLLALAPTTQGHRSNANDRLLVPFLDWLDGLGLAPNQLYGEPQIWPPAAPAPVECGGAKPRRRSCSPRRPTFFAQAAGLCSTPSGDVRCGDSEGRDVAAAARGGEVSNRQRCCRARPS